MEYFISPNFHRRQQSCIHRRCWHARRSVGGCHMGTCPPTSWSGGTSCFVPLLSGDNIFVMHNCTALITLQFSFAAYYVLFFEKLLIFAVTWFSDLHCIVHSITALRMWLCSYSMQSLRFMIMMWMWCDVPAVQLCCYTDYCTDTTETD